MDRLAVLDLYAGTGALGLEAVSRGAASATLIEKDARACGVIFHNLETLGFSARCEVIRGELPEALGQLRGRKFDLVFSDPPYAQRAAQGTVEALLAHDLLSSGARVVLEMDRRELALHLPRGLSQVDERRYGDTVVRVLSAP